MGVPGKCQYRVLLNFISRSSGSDQEAFIIHHQLKILLAYKLIRELPIEKRSLMAKKILVVDDKAELRTLLKQYLTQEDSTSSPQTMDRKPCSSHGVKNPT
jgi:hypothetical protein